MKTCHRGLALVRQAIMNDLGNVVMHYLFVERKDLLITVWVHRVVDGNVQARKPEAKSEMGLVLQTSVRLSLGVIKPKKPHCMVPGPITPFGYQVSDQDRRPTDWQSVSYRELQGAHRHRTLGESAEDGCDDTKRVSHSQGIEKVLI